MSSPILKFVWQCLLWWQSPVSVPAAEFQGRHMLCLFQDRFLNTEPFVLLSNLNCCVWQVPELSFMVFHILQSRLHLCFKRCLIQSQKPCCSAARLGGRWGPWPVGTQQNMAPLGNEGSPFQRISSLRDWLLVMFPVLIWRKVEPLLCLMVSVTFVLW